MMLSDHSPVWPSQAVWMRLLKWVGIGSAGLVGAALLLLVIMQLPFVQRTLLSQVLDSAVQPYEFDAQVNGVGGFWPWRISVADLRLSDSEGEFAQLEDIQLAFRPLGILSGRIAIDRLAIGGGEYSRQPVRPASEDKPFRLPTFPSQFDLAFDISVVDLSVGPILVTIDEAPVTLSGGGSLQLGAAGMNAALAFEAVEAGSARLQILLAPDAQQVEVDIEISDPHGRWLAPLTPLLPGTPIAVSVAARGPQENVAITARAEWGDTRLQAGGTVNWGESVLLAMSGTAENAMPASEQTWAGAQQSFSANMEIASDGTISITDASATAQALNVHLDGTLSDNVALEGRVAISDPTAIAARAGLDALDVREAVFQVSGPRDAPRLTIESHLTRLSVASVDLANLSIELRSGVLQQGQAADLEVRATVGQVSMAGLPQALTSSPLVISTSARSNFEREVLDVSAMNASWGPLEFEMSGELANERPMQVAGVLLVSDLAALDARLSGTARLLGEARRARRGQALSVSLGTETDNFAAVDDLTPLIGPTPRLNLEMRFTEELAEFQNGNLELAGATVTFGGTLDRISRIADLSASYATANNAFLSFGLGGDIAGDARIQGSLDAPQIVATALSSVLQIGGVEARRVDLRLEDTGADGAVTLSADLEGSPLRTSVPYRRTDLSNIAGDLTLAFAGLEMSGPMALEDGAPSANIRAEADDLAPLMRVVRAYGGAADSIIAHGALVAELSVVGREGNLSLTLGGPAIEGIDVPASADDITLTAALDLGHAPALNAQLTATNARFGPSRFSVIDAKAEGPLTSLGATLSLRGPASDPFHLDIAAIRREEGAGSEIEILSLRGQSLDFQVEQTASSSLDVGPNGVALTPTEFLVRNLATGREGMLGVEARLWAGAPYVTLTAVDVPAGALAVFGLPVDWTGQLDGVATLDARGPADRLRIDLTAAGLTNDPDVPPLDVRLTAQATGQMLNADLAFIDTTSRASLLTGNSAMPLSWPAGQPSPTIDWTAPIAGELHADAPIERLWLFVPVDTMSVGGTLVAEVMFGGTLNAPIASGQAQVAQGTLEHFQTGLLLREGEGAFTLTDTGDITADLRATDGNGGRAVLQGTAHLPREENWEVEGRLRLNSMMLARRDELRALASGNLQLSGTLAQVDLTGRITLDRVDAQIPNQMPPTIVDLPIVRVDEQTTAVADQDTDDSERRLRLPVNLDVAVEAPRRVFVRGRGLDSEWEGALHVGGTMGAPRIDGTMSVARGTFDLSRSRFDLTQGSIQFLGGDRIDPNLSIEAQAPGPQFTSILRATGQMRNLAITITSDPVMPQETVMAQILFGKRPDELSAFELVQIAEASATLAGSGGVDVLGSARRATGLDVLSVGSRENAEGGQDVDVTVGRYIAPNVFLGARRGLEPGSGAVTVEMEVTDDITVDAEVRQDSEGSVGIDWRWDY